MIDRYGDGSAVVNPFLWKKRKRRDWKACLRQTWTVRCVLLLQLSIIPFCNGDGLLSKAGLQHPHSHRTMFFES